MPVVDGVWDFLHGFLESHQAKDVSPMDTEQAICLDHVSMQ